MSETMATNEQLIQRIQAQLSASARQNFTPVAVPPFTLYINEETDEPWNNYAIPDASVTAAFEGASAGAIERALTALCAAFRSNGRQPRLEYVHEFVPALAPALRAHGFDEEMHTQLMLCTPESYAVAGSARVAQGDSTSSTPRITLQPLGSQAPIQHFQAYMTVQRRAFGHGDSAWVDAAAAEKFRRRFATSQFFAAWVEGGPAAACDVEEQPAMVSVASLLPGYDGITELAGIGTAATHRRQGIASALTAYAVEQAFDQGLWGVFLTAANAEAGRVYERVGFRSIGTGLAYILPISSESVHRDGH